jgi:hypothetical protein
MSVTLKFGTWESPLWTYCAKGFTFSHLLHIGAVQGHYSQGVQFIIGPALLIIAWKRKPAAPPAEVNHE